MQLLIRVMVLEPGAVTAFSVARVFAQGACLRLTGLFRSTRGLHSLRIANNQQTLLVVTYCKPAIFPPSEAR